MDTTEAMDTTDQPNTKTDKIGEKDKESETDEEVVEIMTDKEVEEIIAITVPVVDIPYHNMLYQNNITYPPNHGVVYTHPHQHPHQVLYTQGPQAPGDTKHTKPHTQTSQDAQEAQPQMQTQPHAQAHSPAQYQQGPSNGYRGQNHSYRGQNSYRGNSYRGQNYSYRGGNNPYRGVNRTDREVNHRPILNKDKVMLAIRNSDDFARAEHPDSRIDLSTYAKWLDRRTRFDRSTQNLLSDVYTQHKTPEDRFITDSRILDKEDTVVTDKIFKDLNDFKDPLGYTFLNKYYSMLKTPFSKAAVNKQNCICGTKSIGTLRQTLYHLCNEHSHMYKGQVKCLLCLTTGKEPKIFDTAEGLSKHLTNAHEKSMFSTHIQACFNTPNDADLFLLGYGQMVMAYTMGQLAKEGHLSNKFWEG